MRRILQTGLVAVLALSTTALVVAESLNPFGEDSRQALADSPKKKFGKFKKEFKTKVNKDQFDKSKAFFEAVPDYFEAFTHVLKDEHWLIRYNAQEAISKLAPGSKRRKEFAEYMKEEKDDNVRHHMLYAWGMTANLEKEDWDVVHEFLKNEKEEPDIRMTAAYILQQWPLPREENPENFPEPKDEEQKKAIEAKTKEVMEKAQNALKHNFQALLDQLQVMSEEKVKKKILKGKDTKTLAFYKMVIHSMERISSQEWDQDFQAWQNWWQKAKDPENILQYRFDRAIIGNVGGTKTKERYVERKLRRVEASAELIVLQPDGFRPEIFSPFMDEFTQYFKSISYFEMPYAAHLAEDPNKGGGKRKVVIPDGYYVYPIERVAKEVFIKRQEDRKTKAGMIAIGSPSTVAMYYSYAKPDMVPFIICVGPWGDAADEGASIGQMRNDSRDEVLADYGLSRSYPDNQKMNEEQRFNAQIGNISHLFADYYHPYQIWAKRRDTTPRTEAEQKERQSRKNAFIDQNEQFPADPAIGKKIPALFIFGEKDPQYVKGTDKKLRKAFPDATIVTMKGVRRMPWIEDPAGFQQIVLEWLEDKKIWKELTGEKKAPK